MLRVLTYHRVADPQATQIASWRKSSGSPVRAPRIMDRHWLSTDHHGPRSSRQFSLKSERNPKIRDFDPKQDVA